jgi:hypothetical protein
MNRYAVVCVCAMTLFVQRSIAQTVVSDPSGDSAGPDIVSISGGYDATHLYLAAAFAPGTFDPLVHGLLFGLDTDVNPATGAQPPITFPVGGEYSVLYNAQFSQTHARVYETAGGSVVGFVSVSFSAGSAQVSILLSLLGGDDGVMAFGAVAGSPINSELFVAQDYAPDGAFEGPLTNVTSFIPSPSGAVLIGACAVLGAVRRRRV